LRLIYVSTIQLRNRALSLATEKEDIFVESSAKKYEIVKIVRKKYKRSPPLTKKIF
jgi:hypothetical protein